MKKVTSFLLFFCCVFSFSMLAQNADEKVARLINSNDWFELERQYPILKNQMQNSMLQLMSEALLSTHFNRPKDACMAVDKLLVSHQHEMGFPNTTSMVFTGGVNMFDMGVYKEAYERLNGFTSQTKSYLDKSMLAQFEYYERLASVLKDYPRSTLKRPAKDVEMPLMINSVGKGELFFIPATLNGNETEFIFDTGCAGFNFVSEEFAEKNGIRILLDSVMARGVKGTYAKLGIADSLVIGELVYYNPLFIVSPPNPQIDTLYQVNAVLGTYFMREVGEIQIYPKQKKFVFPIKESKLPIAGRNYMIINGQPYLEAYESNNRLKFHFDTGNASSNLHEAFYVKNEDWLKKNCKLDTIKMGGYGGISVNQAYIVPSYTFKVGTEDCTLQDIPVYVNKGFPLQSDEDGALGTAFLQLFKKITINFNQMFVEVES